jgi:hypothetical protein
VAGVSLHEQRYLYTAGMSSLAGAIMYRPPILWGAMSACRDKAGKNTHGNRTSFLSSRCVSSMRRAAVTSAVATVA